MRQAVFIIMETLEPRRLPVSILVTALPEDEPLRVSVTYELFEDRTRIQTIFETPEWRGTLIEDIDEPLPDAAIDVVIEEDYGQVDVSDTDHSSRWLIADSGLADLTVNGSLITAYETAIDIVARMHAGDETATLEEALKAIRNGYAGPEDGGIIWEQGQSPKSCSEQETPQLH